MAIRILKAFRAGDQEIGITELAKRLGIAKSTAHRLVTTLSAEDFLVQNPETGRYRLGLELFGLGSLARSRMDIAGEARLFVAELRDEINETVMLGVPVGSEIMYVRVAQSRQAVRIDADMGMRVPYHCTAVGRAVLAFLPAATIATLTTGPLMARTPKTVTEPERLAKQLAGVRRVGYAVEDEENELGMRAVAAPVFDAHAQAVGALAIAAPVQRLPLKNLDSLINPLVSTSRAISARLGYRGSLGGALADDFET